MKKEVSPLMVIAALIVFLGIAAFVYLRMDRRAPAAADSDASSMPPQVTAEIQRRLEKANSAKP